MPVVWGLDLYEFTILKSVLVIKDLQPWRLIGWQHSRQPIRSHDRKSLLTMTWILLSKSRPLVMTWVTTAGSRLNIKTVFPRYRIPMLKIRRSRDRLIFNIGIPILVRRYLYIDTTPSFSSYNESSLNRRSRVLFYFNKCFSNTKTTTYVFFSDLFFQI